MGALDLVVLGLVIVRIQPPVDDIEDSLIQWP